MKSRMRAESPPLGRGESASVCLASQMRRARPLPMRRTVSISSGLKVEVEMPLVRKLNSRSSPEQGVQTKVPWSTHTWKEPLSPHSKHLLLSSSLASSCSTRTALSCSLLLMLEDIVKCSKGRQRRTRSKFELGFLRKEEGKEIEKKIK